MNTYPLLFIGFPILKVEDELGMNVQGHYVPMADARGGALTRSKLHVTHCLLPTDIAITHPQTIYPEQ